MKVFFATFLLLTWRAILCCSPHEHNQISLLSYFPCTHVDNLTSVEECDIFAYIAARLAVERINQSSTILPEHTVELIATATGKGDVADAVLAQSGRYFIHPNNIHGVIGPSNPDAAQRIAPLVGNKLKLLQVSYSATASLLLNEFEYLYRSLPSELYTNAAILNLLGRFEWYTLGILASDNPAHVKAAEDFNSLHTTYLAILGYKIEFSGTFQTPESAEPLLQKMARMRLRIVRGLFGSSDARKVLCRARDYGLTSSEHVWILPSYYNPNWWKLDDTELAGLPEAERCSNDEMVDILNSALFLDPVKYPLLQHGNVELTTSVFHEQLITKTKELFPSLSDSDLTPFLLHSRATRVYEAVWLLVSAWDRATLHGNCSVEFLQESLEAYTYCEWCRISVSCFKDIEWMEFCTVCEEYFLTEGDRNTVVDVIKNFYGQIMVSQFFNGIHCPIGFYWRGYYDDDESKFVKFTDLESSSHCLHKLYLDASILNYTTGCPSEFWWKGRTSPPSGGFSVIYSDIGIISFITTCVLIAFGLVYAIALLVGNIVWRNNKHVKASSPRLNIVIITAFALLLPVPLINALVLSSHEYNIDSSASGIVLCQFSYWLFYLPQPFIYGTLVVKNWRIYHIFHNHKLKEQLSWWLSDKALFLAILLLALPVFVILLINSALHPLELDIEVHESDHSVLRLTYCNSDYERRNLLDFAIEIYFGILLLVLLFLGYQNTKVPSRFRWEGEASQEVLILILVAAPFFVVAIAILYPQPALFRVTFWVVFVWVVPFQAVIMAILFIPKFVWVYKDHVQSSKDIIRRRDSERYQKDYETARTEIQRLRTQIMETNNRIRRLSDAKKTSAKGPLTPVEEEL